MLDDYHTVFVLTIPSRGEQSFQSLWRLWLHLLWGLCSWLHLLCGLCSWLDLSWGLCSWLDQYVVVYRSQA